MTPAEKLILQNQAILMGAVARLLAELCASPGIKRVLGCLEESVKQTSDFVLTSEMIDRAGIGKTGT